MLYLQVTLTVIQRQLGETEPGETKMEKLNQFLPNLKFTYESSQKKVAFLDLNVSFENGCITTDLCTKSTD